MPMYIDADAFEADCSKRYCTGCENYNGIKCKSCWVADMLDEIENAPTLSPEEVRGVGCEVCNYEKPLPQEGLSHDFYIHDGAIYHYDSELGWEGTDIAFCPFCGKRLRMKGAEDGTTDNS